MACSAIHALPEATAVASYVAPRPLPGEPPELISSARGALLLFLCICWGDGFRFRKAPAPLGNLAGAKVRIGGAGGRKCRVRRDLV